MVTLPALKAGGAPMESSFAVVEAWVDDAALALNDMKLRSPTPEPGQPPIRGTATKLEIPLDSRPTDVQARSREKEPEVLIPRRTLSRRDSMKRREALLVGKEGSRRRQRWENSRLIGNPYAEPPLPSDWEVHPTHPVHVVPYFLAPLWDTKYAAKSAARQKQTSTRKAASSSVDGRTGVIPKELRQKLKRARGAKGLLQDLEQQIRHFVQEWEEKQRKLDEEAVVDPDSEDEEIVFVSRTGQMHDMPSSRHSLSLLQREKLVFDSLETDQGASFGRWLVHSIGMYYGLDTWSRTVGDPARREAYVGIKEVKLKSGGRSALGSALPRPLWAIV